VTRVILVRHGESTSNVAGIVQGRGNLNQPELQSTLTSKGQQQATQAGKALRTIAFDHAYVSPLVRTQQTAERIFQEFQTVPKVIANHNLCEIDLEMWEGLDFEKVRLDFPVAYQQWQDQPKQFKLGDRYPIMDLFAQANDFWQETLFKHPDQTILIVGHSGINRALICTAMGIGIENYHCLQQYNCAISVLNFHPDRSGQARQGQAQLESVNVVTHLEPLLGSYLPPLKKNHQGVRILLVRHGETDWNRQGRFQGQIDVPLNPTGERQAEQTGKFLANVKIDCAFSSSMLRPKQTAEKILNYHPGINLGLSDRLREISHGKWEGKLEAEIAAEFPGELQRWQSEPEFVQMPEGENLEQVWQRVAEVWQEMITSVPVGSTALIVAHDAVNKAVLCQIFGLGTKYFWRFKQGNGGISVIDYPLGSEHPAILQTMNVTSHISEGVLDQTAAGAL
jgi:phosphoserine phosphatase